MESMREIVCNNFNRLFENSEFSSYRALAKEIGVNENTLQRWKKKKSYPELPNVERLAKAFKVNPREFYASKDEENPSPVSKTLIKMMAIPDKIYDLAISVPREDEVWEYIEEALTDAKEKYEKLDGNGESI